MSTWELFHHPDICLPVVRRRLGRELLDFLHVFGDLAMYGPLSVALNGRKDVDSGSRAIEQAVKRLSKQGLIVTHQGLKTPILEISEQARSGAEDYFEPDRLWSQKWKGIWYMLVYDIPEVDRKYRNTLRQFFRRERMGCFQKSVWISPRDIRPDFADLAEGAALNAFACLFEARTVLGMRSEEVVGAAWNFERLREVQERYCSVFSRNLSRLEEATSPSPDVLMTLARLEMDAYHSAFVNDPLLPQNLLPYDYLGKKVLALHLQIVSEIQRRVKLVNPE